MTRALVTFALLAGACVEGAAPGAPIELDLPPHFPQPRVPVDNPLTAARIELGRHLFHDARLSGNGAIACSSCHQQRFAFADDRPVSPGATGQPGALNAPALANVAYAAPLTWAHPDVDTIEAQLLGPMFGEDPVEMGMRGAEDAIVARLAGEPRYVELFAAAFPDAIDGPSIDLDRARLALAAFTRSLISASSPFDAYLLGDPGGLSPAAGRGASLFFSARLGCSTCHAGFAFSSAVQSMGADGPRRAPHHNIGLYNIGGDGGYPQGATGLHAITGAARDMGRFRVPTLRNLIYTAPYMHDGSVATLEEVIDIYEAGGRVIDSGPHAGDGRVSPWRSVELPAFELTDIERADLLAFLRSLSDPAFVADPRHADPW